MREKFEIAKVLSFSMATMVLAEASFAIIKRQEWLFWIFFYWPI